MDFIEKISYDIDGFLKPIFTDKISSSIISLILVLYAGLAAPKLPKSISKLFENKIFKLIVLVIIAYTASKDASIAIITAVALVLSMQTLSSYEKPVKVVKKVEVKKQDKVDDKKPTDLQEPSSYDTKNQYHELKNDNIPEIKAPRNTHNKMEAKKNIVRPFSNSEQKYQTVEGFGGEGLVDSHEYDQGFSDTTSASFGVDFLGGAVEDENTSQNEQLTYQHAVDLNTSFTGEDSLDIAIDAGIDEPLVAAGGNFDSGFSLAGGLPSSSGDQGSNTSREGSDSIEVAYDSDDSHPVGEPQTISDFSPAEELAITNSRVDGLEARLNDFEAGGFSETTTASFSVDAAIGAIDDMGRTNGPQRMTVTPGVFFEETTGQDAVKTSFSF